MREPGQPIEGYLDIETTGLSPTIVETRITLSNKGAAYLFPLYVNVGHSKIIQQKLLGDDLKNSASNFTKAFIDAVEDRLNLTVVSDRLVTNQKVISPNDILNYIYAIFYSPTFRTRYAGFLKMDFPRLPLTSSLDLFHNLSKLGGELVALHLMESPKLNTPITEWDGPTPSNEVEKVTYSDKAVWTDKAQTEGFCGVTENVWNFHIGGYQVCEKWLKDRKGRVLSAEDITHYQKIVVALNETIRLMKEIDEVIEEHGGWPGAFVIE